MQQHRTRSLVLLLLVLLKPNIALSEPILFGHNVTPTTYTLPKGGFTVGTYALGLGITDDIMIATSPWLFTSYNMYSAVLKGRTCLVKNGEKCKLTGAAQLMYLKTDHIGQDTYQMTATSSSFIVRSDLTDYYSLNLAFNYSYFFDETNPFSLRREPYNDNPYQVTASALQEVILPDLPPV